MQIKTVVCVKLEIGKKKQKQHTNKLAVPALPVTPHPKKNQQQKNPTKTNKKPNKKTENK